MHFHLKDGIANASYDDLYRLYRRTMDDGDDNTMSITDNHGNIAVYGRPEALLKRGFSKAQFMDNEFEQKLRLNEPGYLQLMKVMASRR